MNDNAWEPLEGTPEALNVLAKGLGLDTQQWHFVDVFGLDNELLSLVPSGAAALVLLYPTTIPEINAYLRRTDSAPLQCPSNVVFLRQLVGGTCATIAVVHAVTNATSCHEAISADSPLANALKEASHRNDLMCRSRHFVECAAVRNAHQAAVMATINVHGTTCRAGQRQGRHFLAFVNRNGNLLELDGRRDAPVSRSTTSADTFLSDAAAEVRGIVASTNDSSVHVRCSLVALVPTNSTLERGIKVWG